MTSYSKNIFMVISCVFVSFITGCAHLLPPEPTVSEYLKTTGGGFLMENRGLIVCRYGLILEPTRELPTDSVLLVEFENPSDATRPLKRMYSDIADQDSIIIKSPVLLSLEAYRNYQVTATLYADQSRTQCIGQHTQAIQSDVDLFSVNRYKSISEAVRFDLDPTKWQLDSVSKTETQQVLEYVPFDQTVENWTELVTTLYNTAQGDIADYLNIVRNQVMKSYRSPEFSILDQTVNDGLYEWSHQGNANSGPEYYLTRVLKTKKGFYTVTYATKTTPVAPEIRAGWLKILKDASVE